MENAGAITKKVHVARSIVKKIWPEVDGDGSLTILDVFQPTISRDSSGSEYCYKSATTSIKLHLFSQMQTLMANSFPGLQAITEIRVSTIKSAMSTESPVVVFDALCPNEKSWCGDEERWLAGLTIFQAVMFLVATSKIIRRIFGNQKGDEKPKLTQLLDVINRLSNSQRKIKILDLVGMIEFPELNKLQMESAPRGVRHLCYDDIFRAAKGDTPTRRIQGLKEALRKSIQLERLVEALKECYQCDKGVVDDTDNGPSTAEASARHVQHLPIDDMIRAARGDTPIRQLDELTEALGMSSQLDRLGEALGKSHQTDEGTGDDTDNGPSTVEAAASAALASAFEGMSLEQEQDLLLKKFDKKTLTKEDLRKHFGRVKALKSGSAASSSKTTGSGIAAHGS